MKKIQPKIFIDTEVSLESGYTLETGYAIGQTIHFNNTGNEYYHSTDGVWKPVGGKGEPGEQGVQGLKGDAFEYSDFTPAQIATLQQPATDAIASIEAVELSVDQAEALRVQAEIDRETNTGTAIQNAETATQNANNIANSKVDKETNKSLVKVKTESNEETAQLGAELLDATGWTLGAGWSGSLDTGFTHTAGSVEPLVFAMFNTGTKKYLVEFTTSQPLGDASIEFYIRIGATSTFDLYNGGSSFSAAIQSLANGNLIITPSLTFAKTINITSLKEVIGISAALTTIKDSTDSISVEQRTSTSALKNVYIGYHSGEYNVSGNKNTAIGYIALQNNVSGFWNTAIGAETLSKNINGSRNVAIGLLALNTNISGVRNVAIGTFSNTRSTNGDRNTSIGSDTLFYNISGSDNVALGFSANYSGVSGNKNIGIGVSSLYSNLIGNNNIGIGSSALYQSKGNNNIAIGYRSGAGITTASNCILIGYDVNPASSADYSLNIGNLIYGNMFNQPAVGIGESNPNDGITNYNPTLHIGSTAKPGDIILGRNTTANGDILGEIIFWNKNNSHAGGTTRKTLAIIRSLMLTTDNNADLDSGANLSFMTKNEAGALTERMEIAPSGRLILKTISEYADNTAAVAAGLVNGTFYKTGDLLKIVHA